MSNPFDGDPKGGRGTNSYNYRDNNQLQEQCLRKQQEIEDSTTESLRLVQETLNSGAATAVELDRQGKQIDNIHDNLVTIQKDIKQSERHVRGMKSIFGAFWNKMKPAPVETTPGPEKITPSKAPVTKSQPKSGGASGSRQLERHALDTDRTHDNLVQIDTGVLSLKEMALSMSNELDRQNTKLGDVNVEATKADAGMVKINRETSKLLAKHS